LWLLLFTASRGISWSLWKPSGVRPTPLKIICIRL